MTIGIRAVDWSLFLHRITTHPQAQSRLVIPRTIVVHTRFLIKLLGIEEVRCVPCIVTFLYEDLAERYILDVLRYLAIEIGDVTTASQVVGVVVELHLLVIVLAWKLLSTAERVLAFMALACAASGVSSLQQKP